MEIKLHLKELREERGLSQRKLAKLADISATCIKNHEKHQLMAPNLVTVCLLAKALDCTLDELVTFE